MDHKFTQLLGDWLKTPENERDYTTGALYLLKLTGNKIMYTNIIANIDRRHDFIEYQLQKYYNFRVQQLTHDEVEAMQKQVDAIVEEQIPLAAKADEAQHRGKRDDHDLLPDEIKALYVENLDLLHRMRELHLKLRTLTVANATCPDSERYPYLKEMIAIDKKMHSNWDRYDHYIPSETTTEKPAKKKPGRKKTVTK